MAKPHLLRPDIRERLNPQVSAYGLAEFIVSNPVQQGSVLHDQRFQNRIVTPKNTEALNVIRHYAADMSRDAKAFVRGREALEDKSNNSVWTDGQRDEAARCVEVLDLFWANKQVWGVDSLPLSTASRFDRFDVSGLTLSVQPDLLIGGHPGTSDGKTGVVFIRAQKAPNPDDCARPETRERRETFRRETARYLLVMGWMLMERQGLALQHFDRKRSVVWDVRLREAIEYPSDHRTREKTVIAAAQQIARLWPTIPPKPSDLI